MCTYSIYARADNNNKVIEIFSTYFKSSTANDVLLKSGEGEEFIHIGGGIRSIPQMG